MRILAVVQGNYGRRIVEYIKARCSAQWKIETYTFSTGLPLVIDKPEQFLPQSLPAADLLLSLGEERGLAELIPDLVKMSGAKAVVAPVDNRDWLPQGLANQIKARLSSLGVEIVFPTPFCTLQGGNGYHPYIRQFAEQFGRPELKLDCSADKVERVDIKREAPCGSTRVVAKGLVGSKISDAPEKAGLLHHSYCWAGVEVDRQCGDSLMHCAAYGTMQAVEEAIKNLKKGG